MASTSRTRFAAAVDAAAPREGHNPTLHPRVAAYRHSAAQPPTPTMYAASLVFVAQGEKRGYLGNRVLDYSAGQYLVVTAPTPMLCEITPDRGAVLALAIDIDLVMLRELVAEVGAEPSGEPCDPAAAIAHPNTPELEAIAIRLVGYLADPVRARVLAPQAIRELIFEALHGPNRDRLIALAATRGSAAHLAGVIRYMNQHYTRPLRIEALARMARMSTPTFHERFKAVTACSPLQYLKAIRLNRARLLLTETGTTAKHASVSVGYQSESQFSREYRRLFGSPPMASIRAGRDTVAP
jgi:AraC-like DNA-binding protein